MIAAAPPPAGGTSPGAGGAGQAASPPSRPARTDALRDGDTVPEGAAKSRPSQHSGATDRTARRGHPDAGAGETPSREFADLLADATGEDEATAATADPAREPAPAAPASPAQSPGEMLALLAGALAVPATPSPEAAPAASPATPKDARPAPALPAALAAPAADAGGALAPAPADAAAAGALPPAAFAVLAKPGTDATASASDAAATVGDAAQAAALASIPGGAATATGARHAVVPGAPLALPADPDAGFDDGFGARIAWMAEQRLGHAEIRLNPEHLGPIDVRVQLEGTRVAAEFHSAHAEVRQAIEASVPRLRELLGQHGLQLGHADVGQRHAQGQAPRRDGARGEDTDVDAGATRPLAAAPRLRSRGLLDEYA